MKKIVLLVITCHFISTSFAFYPIHTPVINKDQQALMYCLLNHAPVKHYKELLGRKLSLNEKINYFLLKNNLKKLEENDSSKFNLGGFLLGFVLGPVGVGIAYLTSKNKRFKKWAVIGFTSLVGLAILSALLFVTIAGRF